MLLILLAYMQAYTVLPAALLAEPEAEPLIGPSVWKNSAVYVPVDGKGAREDPCPILVHINPGWHPLTVGTGTPACKTVAWFSSRAAPAPNGAQGGLTPYPQKSGVLGVLGVPETL